MKAAPRSISRASRWAPDTPANTLQALFVLACGLVLIALWLLPPLLVASALAGIVAIATILRWPVVGFALLAFSVPWASGMSLPAGSFPVSPTEILVAAIGGVWITRAVAERTNPFRGAPWIVYIAIFLVAICLSVTQASDNHASLREILKWAELGVVYLAGLSLLTARRDVVFATAAVLAAGVTQALLGFVQFGLNLGPQAFASERLFLRAYGTFDQPNPYAGYLNMVLPIALALVLVGPRGRWRSWSRLATVLIAGALLASESRGALLAGLAALSVVAAMSSVRLSRLFWAGVLALLGAGLFAAFGFPIGPVTRLLDAIGVGSVSFGDVTDANFSVIERAAHWLAGVRMFAAHPLLGVGIGNYANAYPLYHPRGWYASLEHAHNYYINIAAEAGIFGLGAYVLLIGSGLWYSCAATRSARDPLYRALALGVTGALVATSFHNIFDVLFVHGTTALIGLLMALATIGVGRCAPSQKDASGVTSA